MSYRLIHNILDEHLNSIAGLPNHIKENEIGYLPSDDDTSSRRTKYCRSTILPIETQQLTVGTDGFDNFQGLYQVDLFFPYGDGSDGTDYMVDLIIANFEAGTHLKKENVVVQVENYFREPGFQGTNFYMVPVVIRWRSHIQRQYTHAVIDYT